MSDAQVVSTLTVTAVDIQGVDFFGPRIGFIKFKVLYYCKDIHKF
jgi:hypothetical protein